MRTTARSMELRRERTMLVADARAIIDGSEVAGRSDLNADEERQYRDLMAKIEALDGKIHDEESPAAARRAAGGAGDRRDRLATYEREGARPITGPIDPPGSNGRQTPASAGFLTRGQSFADAVRQMPSYRAPSSDDGPFSLGRAVRGMVLGEWRNAEAERRALMQSGGATGTDYLLPEDISADLIDLARAQAALFRAGALTRPMEAGTVSVPRLDADPTPSWKLEGVEGTGTNPTLGAVIMRAKTMMCAIRMTVESVEDSDPNDLTTVVSDAVSRSMAVEIDRTGLRGAGVAAEPAGLLTAIAGDGGSVTALGADGGYLEVDDLSSLASIVEGQNYAPSAFVWHPTIAGQLARAKSGEGEYLIGSSLPANIADVPRLSTTSIPTNLTVGGSGAVCSELYTGQFDQLVWGVRTQMKIEILREGSIDGWSAASGLGVILRAYLRGDWMVKRGSAFAIYTGVKSA